MRVLFAMIFAPMALIASPVFAASSPKLDSNASAVLVNFWASLKSDDGKDGTYVAENATLSAMSLGGRYDRKVMRLLASDCELVALLGGNAKTDSDPTKYSWAVLECLQNGKVETLPLGVGIKGEKITQMEIDMFSRGKLDRSLIDRPAEEPAK